GKRLQLLKEAVPWIAQVAIFWDSSAGPLPLELYEQAAQAVGIALHPLEVGRAEEFEDAFGAAAQVGVDALLVVASPLSNSLRKRIAQLAMHHRWPSIYDQRQYVEDGGLLLYAANQTDTWRRVAVYADKIFRGANPAELPIEQPMRFDFVAN